MTSSSNIGDTGRISLAVLFMIGLGVLGRVLPHPANFAPITGLALFGGSYLPKRWALVIPLVAMAISDAFIGYYGLGTMVAVYGSFLLVGLIGLWVRNHRSIGVVLGASLASSLLFFLITNAAVWLDPLSGYAAGLHGLLASYVAGLPFFRGTFVGDLVYTCGFFGAYELAKMFAHRHLPERLIRIVF